MATVYTGGTFDLLHDGHLELLEACRRMAGVKGIVVVGLNTDEFVARFKDAPPVMDYGQRKRLLTSCRYVDRVVKNIGGEDSTKTIESVKDEYRSLRSNGDYRKVGPVSIVAIGTDWAGRDYYGQMGFTAEWLDRRGIVLVYVDRRTGESTTAIKERLRAEA